MNPPKSRKFFSEEGPLADLPIIGALLCRRNAPVGSTTSVEDGWWSLVRVYLSFLF